ncbi:MAG TPA: ABC transporter ATP-binding protein [Hyphomicrobiaceae bacterium]|nr:ABC transporter ATP-binding protein [Hyphomicrobiaceae bacterium]
MSLELRNVVKRVSAGTHIHETSLELAETGFNVLLGPTLAGKTTLMQLMAGLDRPTAGSIWLNGRDVTGVPVRKRNVSMVYQQFINYANLTVFENIASPLRVARLRRAEIDDRVHRIAELLHLKPLLERRPGELSGGQQQRTALARALVKDADLVLLDEPLANLDFKLREELRDELPRLFADRRSTVVFATTDPMEALLLGGHTAALHEGRITQFGPTAEVYRRPADLRTAMVLANPPINTAPVVKDGDRIVLNGNGVGWTAQAEVLRLPNGRYTLGVRPYHVSPVRNGGAIVEIGGKVQITELSGAESVVHFAHGSLSWISQSHGVHAMQVGETATFYLDAARCMYFDADGRLVAS